MDKIDFGQYLPSVSQTNQSYSLLSEDDFHNLVNDFWYHAVWTTKKLRRGELWTAKSCLDGYMKEKLLTIIECHAHVMSNLNCVTWYNGRFIEKWAEDWIIEQFSHCFSHYNKEDIKSALLSTMNLFRLVALEVAQQLNYKYPKDADDYSSSWVKNNY